MPTFEMVLSSRLQHHLLIGAYLPSLHCHICITHSDHVTVKKCNPFKLPRFLIDIEQVRVVYSS